MRLDGTDIRFERLRLVSATGHQGQEFVVWSEGPDGPVYLDNTGTGVLDIVHAKRFEGEAEAHTGIEIAELAPTGADGPWHVKPVAHREDRQ
jgi:hypothetical protein